MSTFDANAACGQSSSAASIWPVWFASSSIACLPRITSCGCSCATIARSSFATASGCNSTSVSTRIARSAPSASAVRSVSWHAADAAGDGDDLGGHALLLQPHRLLHRDLVERIHRHLHVRRVHARAVGLDANLDVVIDDALDRNENFHGGHRRGKTRIIAFRPCPAASAPPPSNRGCQGCPRAADRRSMPGDAADAAPTVAKRRGPRAAAGSPRLRLPTTTSSP